MQPEKQLFLVGNGGFLSLFQKNEFCADEIWRQFGSARMEAKKEGTSKVDSEVPHVDTRGASVQLWLQS